MKVAELAEQTTKEFNRVYVRFEQVDARFDQLENLVRGLYDLFDGLANRKDTERQEAVMTTGRLNRHERWIEEIARHNNLKLKS